MRIFSLGTSSLKSERFIDLLRGVGTTAVADVRSAPYSRQFPWFSQNELKLSLRDVGISYAFLGEELGGRPSDDDLFTQDGVADYRAMACTANFKSGIKRLMDGSQSHTITLICSESDPLHCHRCLLVGRALLGRGMDVTHVHSNGNVESQFEAEQRLLREENLTSSDFLYVEGQRLEEAYLRRNLEVAYKRDRRRKTV